MINWNESAKLNNCTVDELKAYFEKFPKSNKKIIRICDGCGGERKLCFVDHTDLCFKCACKTPEHCKAISDAAIKHYAKEMDPLPPGQTIAIPDNKNCAQYLGCIAEELLAKTFKDVRRMPHGNKGFDIICNQNYRIDIKSSATGYKGGWMFEIRKNQIADYFLCIAFESREDLTPVHVWLIPDKDINHLAAISISKTTLNKWSKYEQPLDRVLACCDIMKGETLGPIPELKKKIRIQTAGMERLDKWTEPKGL